MIHLARDSAADYLWSVSAAAHPAALMKYTGLLQYSALVCPGLRRRPELVAYLELVSCPELVRCPGLLRYPELVCYLWLVWCAALVQSCKVIQLPPQ